MIWKENGQHSNRVHSEYKSIALPSQQPTWYLNGRNVIHRYNNLHHIDFIPHLQGQASQYLVLQH